MVEKQKTKLELDYSPVEAITEHDVKAADAYIDAVRSAYQDGFEYRGHKSDEQLDNADTASLESDMFIDDYIAALGLQDHQTDTLGNIEGGVNLDDMRDAWRHLWVGFHTITNRIAGKNHPLHKLTQLSELEPKEKMLIMQRLFGDFQEHNALRFGAKGMGMKQTRAKRELGLEVFDDETGDKVTETYEPDKLDTYEAIGERALRIGYETQGTRPGKAPDDNPIIYMHTAGKVSPKEARQLRREYRADFRTPEQFYARINTMRNPSSSLENQGR